jgi:hypothetical protein
MHFLIAIIIVFLLLALFGRRGRDVLGSVGIGCIIMITIYLTVFGGRR